MNAIHVGDIYICNELLSEEERAEIGEPDDGYEFVITAISDSSVSYKTVGADEAPTTRPLDEFNRLFSKK